MLKTTKVPLLVQQVKMKKVTVKKDTKVIQESQGKQGEAFWEK